MRELLHVYHNWQHELLLSWLSACCSISLSTKIAQFKSFFGT